MHHIRNRSEDVIMLDMLSNVDGQKKLSVAMVLFHRVTLLDLIGPATALGFHADVHLVAKTMDPVASDQGVKILPTCTFDECPTNWTSCLFPAVSESSTQWWTWNFCTLCVIEASERDT